MRKQCKDDIGMKIEEFSEMQKRKQFHGIVLKAKREARLKRRIGDALDSIEATEKR